jgi:hypothetical protein
MQRIHKYIRERERSEFEKRIDFQTKRTSFVEVFFDTEGQTVCGIRMNDVQICWISSLEKFLNAALAGLRWKWKYI